MTRQQLNTTITELIESRKSNNFEIFTLPDETNILYYNDSKRKAVSILHGFGTKYSKQELSLVISSMVMVG